MPGVSAARLGDLLDRHGAALVLYARQFCRSAEDVVQEAFVQLARQHDLPNQPAAWLYRVVRNGALSAARADERRRKHETGAARRRSAWFQPGDAARLDAEMAAEALQHMPIEEREIIVAHLWGGLTFQQIGELVGMSAPTAYRRYVAGLQTLKTRLEKRSIV